jgi:integrase/recombinase XerD
VDATKLKRQMIKFENYLMVDRGLAKNTAGGYCRAASIALRRMKRFSPNSRDIRTYILWLRGEDYSFNHCVNSALALEHYTRMKGNTVRLARPKKPVRLIQDTLTEAEVSRMLTASRGVRVKSILCVLAYGGLRNDELCNLKVRDLDLGANQITVRDGKNRQDGVVNIAPEATKVLIEYLREYPRGEDHYLFTTLKTNKQLRTNDVRKHVKATAKLAQLNRRVYPHLFRHSLATNLLNKGASLMMIQQQLRHRHIESTMIYVRSRPLRNRSEYDFFKPSYL